jgi:hypothetical protein
MEKAAHIVVPEVKSRFAPKISVSSDESVHKYMGSFNPNGYEYLVEKKFNAHKDDLLKVTNKHVIALWYC